MMIRLLQIILFFFTFTIEVEVHALIVSLPNQDEVTQEPQGCLWAESACAVKTQIGRKYATKIGTTHVLMGSDTIIVRLGQDSLLLVEGEVWIKAENAFTARTEYGDVEIGPEGEIWLVRSEKRALVRSLKLISHVQARKSVELVILMPGFEIFMEGVTKEGHGHLTLPSVLDFRDHLRRWARLYRGPKQEFAKEVRSFGPILQSAARASSAFDVEMAQRQIASEKISSSVAEERRRSYDLESERLRKLFRERANR